MCAASAAPASRGSQQIALIVFDSVDVEQLAQLIRERLLSMVLFLVPDVVLYAGELRFAHGDRGTAVPPLEPRDPFAEPLRLRRV